MSSILVRRPSPLLADGELTHLDRVPIDPALALSQWAGYVRAFADHGWSVAELEPTDDLPDGVFVEDALVVFDGQAVLARAGAVSRRGEADTAERAAAAQGLPVHRIVEPGTLDGGDVLKIGRTVYVGLSSRTNQQGIDQLATVLGGDWTVVPVPVTRVLHLKSAVTALPDGTVIGHPPLVDDPTVFPDFLPVPEPEGTAVVVLDPTTVLMSASAPLTTALLRERGLTVITVAVSEFEKAEGCVTCLSVRVR